MKEHCRKNWPGGGLIFGGSVVFIVGIAIVLFKELDIPRYWIPAVVGALLILAGMVVRGLKSMYDCRTSQSGDSR